MPWRNRRRPIFEAQWAAAGAVCLRWYRRQCVANWGWGSIFARSASPQSSTWFVDAGAGWITHPQLQRALAAQRESGTGRIGEWLMSECGLEPEQDRAWSEHAMGMSGADDGGILSGGYGTGAAEGVCRTIWIAASSCGGSRILYLGFADRLDASSAFATEQMTELKVESGVVEGARSKPREQDCSPATGGDEAGSGRDKDAMAARITAILNRSSRWRHVCQAASILLAADMAGERRSGSGSGQSPRQRVRM